MHIVTRARGFDLSDEVREHVRRRLGFSLDWAYDRVISVLVVLSDVNGPRGGKDKRCRIQVAVTGAADVLIDDTQADLYVAIDRAVDRAGRTLARHVARQRQRQPGRTSEARAVLLAGAQPDVAATTV
ncbi:HPF/RaiA family ribosome-associated protein [Accumulibacter sp.]|uniref:HPF/RaiA family ribosome-associated protein n=1 Tax=Accumulibacter sp. TaxID=2053492 RepID=UPI0035B39874